MKNILMIAYAFPPFNFSGTARPFGFAKHLGDFGWRPTVVTREGTGGFDADESMLSELKGRCEIVRVQVGDGDDWPGWVRKYFGWGGRRISEGLTWRARNWFPGLKDHVHWGGPAVKAGLELARKKQFDLVWATGDPWSSVMAGYRLSKLLKIPFVADLRDPWTYGTMWSPATDRIAAYHQRWERKILGRAKRTVFTSPLTTDIMRGRVDSNLADRLVTITNGFDEFDGEAKRDVSEDKCLFSFVGHLSKRHKQPGVLLEGLKRACRDRELAESICFEFVGKTVGYEEQMDRPYIRYVPPVTQKESRRVMRGSDVLVLLQTITGSGCDVISGKAYEYLAAGRPILGVVPEDGGDAWLIRETKSGVVTGTSDPEKVAEGILHFWRLWKEKKLVSPVTPEAIGRFSRRNLTRELAELFDEILDEEGARVGKRKDQCHYSDLESGGSVTSGDRVGASADA
jgi:hypothetical protein